jgi:hypothetical protein
MKVMLFGLKRAWMLSFLNINPAVSWLKKEYFSLVKSLT